MCEREGHIIVSQLSPFVHGSYFDVFVLNTAEFEEKTSKNRGHCSEKIVKSREHLDFGWGGEGGSTACPVLPAPMHITF